MKNEHKKKILVIHNFYKESGGEDTNIYEELEFLKKYYEVKFFYKKNKNRLNLSDFLGFLLLNNIRSNQELKNTIETFKPDVVYIHNMWFKVNLGIFRVLKRKKIKVILKIHNFRYDCAKYYSSRKHLKGLSQCYACNYSFKKNRIINKYYENSYVKSFFLIHFSKKYFKILKDYPLKIIVLNNFHKNKLLKLGVNDEKIYIINNPISIEKVQVKQKNNFIVYAGRLSEDKGLEELIVAWRNINLNQYELHIIGEGPQKKYLHEKYNDRNIKFIDYMENNEVIKYIRDARAVVTATKLYEGQPRLLTEASSVGTISIFPSFGGMSEFFPKKYEFSFEQFDYKDLEKKLLLLTNKKLVNEVEKRVIDYSEKFFDQVELFIKFSNLVGE